MPRDLLTILLEWAFAAAMVAAAIFDIRSRRLPNWLNLAVALGFLPWAWAMGFDWGQVGIHTAVGLVVLGLGFVLFAIGVIGGGDAKLGAAVALWIGFSFELLRFFLIMSVAGGILAVIALIWQARTRRPLTSALPYGVAIGAAGLDYWFHQSTAGCALSGC